MNPGGGRTSSTSPSPPPDSRPQALPLSPPSTSRAPTLPARTWAELKRMCKTCPKLQGTITEATEKKFHSVCDALAFVCGGVAFGATIADLKHFNLIASALGTFILGGKCLAKCCMITIPEASGLPTASGSHTPTATSS